MNKLYPLEEYPPPRWGWDYLHTQKNGLWCWSFGRNTMHYDLSLEEGLQRLSNWVQRERKTDPFYRVAVDMDESIWF